MNEWQMYWKDFEGSRARGQWPSATQPPFDWWRTNSRRLRERICHGDRLWLFISGSLYGYRAEPAVHQAYLAQILRVEACVDNPDFDRQRPQHPVNNVKYRIVIQDDGCMAIDPPLLVEDLIFSQARAFPPSKGETVGEKLQATRTLDSGTIRALRARLREDRPGIDICG